MYIFHLNYKSCNDNTHVEQFLAFGVMHPVVIPFSSCDLLVTQSNHTNQKNIDFTEQNILLQIAMYTGLKLMEKIGSSAM